MALFGASVYLHLASKKELTNYIELLGKYKIKLIFTTLISFKKEDEENWEKLKLVTGVAKKYQIEIYADIDGNSLKEFDLLNKKPKNLVSFFINMGLAGIRCDDGIALDLQAKLTQNNRQFKIIINGSHNIIHLEQMILNYKFDYNNVISCYNFYPQRYTGASVDFYLINQYESHINNISFAGFVTLLGKEYHGPWEYEDNLPSLEIHRNWTLLAQVHHLIALGTEIILIANQFIKEEDLKMLQSIDQEKLSLAIEPMKNISNEEKTILFDEKIHFVRPDLAQDIIRSTMPRVSYKELMIEPRFCKSEYFEVGDVVILNHDAKNYMRELQIITKRVKNDGIRNLVAKVKEPYLSYFLTELKATRSFKFIS
ncbi:MAG: MupG family TIM beta-alpha barrel fold protein [Spiroplasma sp.]